METGRCDNPRNLFPCDRSDFERLWLLGRVRMLRPGKTFSFRNMARPSGPFGNIPLTANSMIRSGLVLTSRSKDVALIPPG